MSAGIFDKGGAAFNPVSIVEIEDFSDRADLRLMDMAADDAVQAALSAACATTSSKRQTYSTASLTACFSQADSDQ